eukprot:CAMPEP_0185921152 /NCGR_PEP_ID=MMETSP0924C-20121207/8680_1 /TAXON_ID=321610 /ORGANISM="Perkinsus chesapeaki, Strain ATCC PRA-65" /LENGTH=33 /DNA_ID= /DNA_START= /DNA_END= /DNA_ORIENTATION=
MEGIVDIGGSVVIELLPPFIVALATWVSWVAAA